MSKMKRLMSSLLLGCIVTSTMSLGANAAELSADTINQPEKVCIETENAAIGNPELVFTATDVVDVGLTMDDFVSLSSDDWEVTVLDEESYKQSLIENFDMSPSEAAAKSRSLFVGAKGGVSPRIGSDEQYVQFQSYAYPSTTWKNKGWGLRYGFQAIMSDGSNPVFRRIHSKWAKVCGSGPHTYEPDTLAASVKSTTRAQIAGGGDLIIAVKGNVSVKGGFSVPTIKSWGFELSSSVSGTYYYRKYISFNKTFRPAWAN